MGQKRNTEIEAVVRRSLEELGKTVIPWVPHSPDPAPSDGAESRPSPRQRHFQWNEKAGAGSGRSESVQNSSRLAEKADLFLRDVLNQAHEFSALTGRFQRAGIRSASMQGRILKKLIGEGYIRTWDLAVGRGRPLKLAEPTERAFGEYRVKWKKTRGVLPTRAATEMVYAKICKLDGWSCLKEGALGDKQVDLLCRSKGSEHEDAEEAGKATKAEQVEMECLGAEHKGLEGSMCQSQDAGGLDGSDHGGSHDGGQSGDDSRDDCRDDGGDDSRDDCEGDGRGDSGNDTKGDSRGESELVAIEISHSGNEVHGALHNLKHGVARHWVVCTSQRTLTRVRERFAEIPQLRANPERVHVTTLGRVLRKDWLP